MSFNFGWGRLLTLGICLLVFWLLGGFDFPDVEGSQHRLRQAWLRWVALYVVGAVNVSLIDHKAGTMDPTNLRFAYILLGSMLMLGGVLLSRSAQ